MTEQPLSVLPPTINMWNRLNVAFQTPPGSADEAPKPDSGSAPPSNVDGAGESTALGSMPSGPENSQCGFGLYFEPSFLAGLVGFPSATLLNRFALGARVRNCSAEGVPASHLRLGVTGHLALSNITNSGIFLDGGAGAEAEFNRPISQTLRLGVRAGAEQKWPKEGERYMMLALGARLHWDDTLWLGVDSLYLTSPSSSFGLTAGVGLEGSTGARLGLGTISVYAGIALVIGALLLGLTHSH